MNRTWVLIDASQLGYAAFYKLGGLSWKGNPTGVIYGFLGSIIFLQRDFPTANFVFCFDYGKNKRCKLHKGYKKNRKKKSEEEIEKKRHLYKQMDLLRTKYLPMIGYRNVFFQKGYEGDDIIASICQNLPKGDEAVIVSNDEDMFQLLNKKVRIHRTNKKDIMTAKRFRLIYGIKPKSWITVKAIAGCSTDEVKGVQGVGEKSVIQYLRGELKEGSAKHDAITSPEGKRIMARNWKVVQLPLEGTKTFKLKRKEKLDGWKRTFAELGINHLKDPNEKTSAFRKDTKRRGSRGPL